MHTKGTQVQSTTFTPLNEYKAQGHSYYHFGDSI